MARSRRLRRNPSIPRLEWVAKNYPESVWYYTVLGFFNAAGMDGAVIPFIHRIEYMTASREDGLSSEPKFPAKAQGMVDAEIRDYSAEVTDYDRYIPWLARSINRAAKPILKRVKKIAKKSFPDLKYSGGMFEAPISVDIYSLVEDTSSWLWTASNRFPQEDRQEMNRLASELRAILNKLTEKFGTVVRWAEIEGINLDDYEGEQAVDLAVEWVRTRPKGGDVVGGTVVYEFPDGWTFQELKTKAQLKCEGMYLDHCVKHYKPSKIGKIYRIYSLRDADGNPVATMEWNVPDEYVYQFKSLSNEWPEKDAIERAIEFRRKYLDEKLLSPDNKLEQVSHYSEIFPPLAGEFKAEGFSGVYMPPGRPDLAFAHYEGGFREQMVNAWGLRQFIEDQEMVAADKFGAGDSEAIDEYVLKQVRATAPVEIPATTVFVEDYSKSMPWEVWKLTGDITGDDELLEQAGYYDIPNKVAEPNPRKRKTPEYKRLIDRCHKLWETYDEKPLKRNLVAFGKHIDKMRESDSARVKTEVRRAARAFNKEFKTRGWKR